MKIGENKPLIQSNVETSKQCGNLNGRKVKIIAASALIGLLFGGAITSISEQQSNTRYTSILTGIIVWPIGSFLSMNCLSELFDTPSANENSEIAV